MLHGEFGRMSVSFDGVWWSCVQGYFAKNGVRRLDCREKSESRLFKGPSRSISIRVKEGKMLGSTSCISCVKMGKIERAANFFKHKSWVFGRGKKYFLESFYFFDTFDRGLTVTSRSDHETENRFKIGVEMTELHTSEQ